MNHCFCHAFGRGGYVICCDECKDVSPSCLERLKVDRLPTSKE